MSAKFLLSVIVCASVGAGLVACDAGSEDVDPTPVPGEDPTGGNPSTPNGSTDGGSTDGDSGTPTETGTFSFFVTSIESMRQLSGSTNGFGGDLRYGEATGLEGADKICRTIAEASLPGAGQKTWRAFLSASAGGPEGGVVNAIDRIGEGPWYDRLGRLVAQNKAALLSGSRPLSDAQIKNDLPNERGEPNHQGVDNHDVLTGSTSQGKFSGSKSGTCNDWTSAVGSTGKPMCGHSWPRSGSTGSGSNWMSDHQVPGCAPGVTLTNTGGGGGGSTVGGSGGYGAIYCFALTP
ncbi:hypothetical protein CYFUS_007895 [Cystobacter fuscus]|uniref:Lipoprotein n=1 Tax=Cystobacter fuscus TaxID=43 RepID=A0A250JG11_9BACT|nr:hypothetical protein [Cystobacter fuscus]ATB42417.1 hypothetical protein CYFUS_007895 [Cystobacter fuscus]